MRHASEFFRMGKCNITEEAPQGTKSGMFLYNFAVSVPILLILVGYIFIGTALEVEKRRKQRVLKSQSQVPVERIQVTLLVMATAVVLFCLPVVIAENMDVDIELLKCIFGWYWWMYAVNFFIYVTTLQDFRRMFKQVFEDLKMCSSSVKPTSSSTSVSVTTL